MAPRRNKPTSGPPLDIVRTLVLETRRKAPDLAIEQLVDLLRIKCGKQLTIALAREILNEPLPEVSSNGSALGTSEPVSRGLPRGSHGGGFGGGDGRAGNNRDHRQPGKNATPAQIEDGIRRYQECEKRPAFLQWAKVMEMAMLEGKPYRGRYALLMDEDVEKEEYPYTEMVWVDCSTDPVFERMKLEATLGSAEATWMLWKSLTEALKENREGREHVKDKTVARQLEREYGTNPLNIDAAILDRNASTPEAKRFATLMASLM